MCATFEIFAPPRRFLGKYFRAIAAPRHLILAPPRHLILGGKIRAIKKKYG